MNEKGLTKVLFEAISYTSHDRLLSTLKSLCEQRPKLTVLLAKSLVIHRESEIDTRKRTFSSIDFSETDADTNSNNKKIKVSAMSGPRFLKCGRCDEEFDVTTNHKRACLWHEENERYPDYNALIWENHDEEEDGRIEDLMDDDNYAAGFIYSCCLRDLTTLGCMGGWHYHHLDVLANEKLRCMDDVYLTADGQVEGREDWCSSDEEDEEEEPAGQEEPGEQEDQDAA